MGGEPYAASKVEMARLVVQSARSLREGSADMEAAATRKHGARAAGVKTLPACRLSIVSFATRI